VAIAVVALQPADCAEIAGFFAAQTGDSPSNVLERLEWLTRNPGMRDDVPFGWGVRTGSGDLAGAMLCIPYRFVVRGRIEWFLMSSGFYVDAAARGAGIQIFLRYRSLADRFVLYTTTANEQAAALWQATGATPIPKTEYELVRPLRWARTVEEALSTHVGRTAARIAASAIGPIDVVRLHRRRPTECTLKLVERLEDAVATAGALDDAPTLVRDAPFLRWRYVEIPQFSAGVYRVGRPDQSTDAFVALTGAARGSRFQLRCTYVADVWGDVSPSLFRGVLEAVAEQQLATTDLLVIRSLPDEHEAVARHEHFWLRPFSHAIGWHIDRRRVTGHAWVMTPAGSEIV
jgi:hypothetical protein